MSSILTNTSAMVALQTMRGINKNLAQTQSQISTGKSIANARDNAAVWAISKTMESDVKGFKSISDSLAMGSATVGVARQAAETVTDLLTQMKGRIVAAQENNVDRAKIQEDVDALREQIRSVVGAAQFNGLNLVDGSETDASILASLDRNSTGEVAARQIVVAGFNLSSQAAEDPIEELFADSDGAEGVNDRVAFVVEDENEMTLAIDDDAVEDVEAGDRFVLTIGDRQVSYTVSAADVDEGDPEVNIAAGIRQAILNSGIAISVEDDAGDDTVGIKVVADEDGELTITNNTENDLMITARREGAGDGLLAALNGIDVDGAHEAALADIDALIQTSINAASSFGSAQMRVDTQAEFIKNLTDSLNTGIGSLVDADMEAASARLQALQVQQQLATQSLSIANQQPQNILALFR